MGKLIIHETDSRGDGVVVKDGQVYHYSHNGEISDIREVVMFLIKIGTISNDEVEIYSGDEIYLALQEYENDR